MRSTLPNSTLPGVLHLLDNTLEHSIRHYRRRRHHIPKLSGTVSELPQQKLSCRCRAAPA